MSFLGIFLFGSPLIPNRDLDELQYAVVKGVDAIALVSIPNRDLDELQFQKHQSSRKGVSVSIPNRDLDELQFAQISHQYQFVPPFQSLIGI